MRNYQRKVLILGAVIALLCVAIGAFGAHALKGILSEAGRHNYELGVRYAFLHALAIMLCAFALPLSNNQGKLKIAVRLLTLGVILFSGSLVVYAISEVRMAAMIIPLGGLCFLAGWLMFILSLRK